LAADKESEAEALNGELRRLKKALEDLEHERSVADGQGKKIRAERDRLQGEVDYLVSQKRELEVEVERARGAYDDRAVDFALKQRELEALAGTKDVLSSALGEKVR
jgi:predicted  nucleic acid-binding Zn-ribbon protein